MKNREIVPIIVLFLTSISFATYVSPISHDPNSDIYWHRCRAAYDNKEWTYAVEKVVSAQQPLDLIFLPSIDADGWYLSLWGKYGTSDSFELWFYHGNDWHLEWDGSTWESPWESSMSEYAVNSLDYDTFSSDTNISKARIISLDKKHYLCVLEFKLHLIPEPSTIVFLIFGFLISRLYGTHL